ncbi:MT-A70-domain-containing protein [Bimuria novae-zelandiae CBS 107.79]|uniref:MT-A70-domain-containing protein n=1 Tax=Bimuria novae-zelandiae CBS 107.79 TaxID=1447943 RepID=A0A6A5VD99_9PLEO|nr:MT-A70-domain-containing protein [Bimuria novae-zelandiae CBS 107.79]
MPGFKSGMQPRKAILYQNADQDITLIDIPTSIAAAQGRPDTLLSTAPLDTPYQLHEEPKSSQAKKNQSPHLTDLHIEYRSAIHAALAEIRSHITGPWCLPRKLMAQVPKPRDVDRDMQLHNPEKEIESRLREWSALDRSKGKDTHFDFQKMMASLGAAPDPNATAFETVAQKWLVSYGPPRDDAHVPLAEPTEPWTSSFHNPEDHPLDLRVRENVTQPGLEAPEYRFTVPSRATFFLSDSTHSDAFRTAFRELTDDYVLPRHFDLVLLDPPWPNRSARRKGAYEMTGGMPQVQRMLLKMDIDNYFEHNALVGVWITNKEAMRAHVLGEGGLFEQWNVGLVEEWIWVKVTTQGEPMFDIDSTLRKPYEVLLLGRAAPNAWTRMEHARVPKKKVIAAVPDVHSRKPCLKELLEPYMPDASDYSALEVFSRNLVTGWTSWGNEVIKFNWEKYWAPSPRSE